LHKNDQNLLKIGKVEWPNVLYAPTEDFLKLLIFGDFMAKNVQKSWKLAKMDRFRDLSSTKVILLPNDNIW